MKSALVAGTVVALAGAAGCSGLKTYPDQEPKNIHVTTHVDRSVRAALHVHEITGPCTSRYEGTVTLDKPTIDVGIAADRPLYLLVTFDTSSFLSGSRATSSGTMMRARAGYAYGLDVSYRQDMYNVTLREIDRRGVSRELAHEPLVRC